MSIAEPPALFEGVFSGHTLRPDREPDFKIGTRSKGKGR